MWGRDGVGAAHCCAAAALLMIELMERMMHLGGTCTALQRASQPAGLRSRVSTLPPSASPPVRPPHLHDPVHFRHRQLGGRWQEGEEAQVCRLLGRQVGQRQRQALVAHVILDGPHSLQSRANSVQYGARVLCGVTWSTARASSMPCLKQGTRSGAAGPHVTPPSPPRRPAHAARPNPSPPDLPTRSPPPLPTRSPHPSPPDLPIWSWGLWSGRTQWQSSPRTGRRRQTRRIRRSTGLQQGRRAHRWGVAECSGCSSPRAATAARPAAAAPAAPRTGAQQQRRRRRHHTAQPAQTSPAGTPRVCCCRAVKRMQCMPEWVLTCAQQHEQRHRQPQPSHQERCGLHIAHAPHRQRRRGGQHHQHAKQYCMGGWWREGGLGWGERGGQQAWASGGPAARQTGPPAGSSRGRAHLVARRRRRRRTPHPLGLLQPKGVRCCACDAPLPSVRENHWQAGT